MGCCASSVSPAPYNQGQHGNASSRNPIISSQPHSNLPRPSTAQSVPPQRQPHLRRRTGQRETPDGKPDADLIPLKWTDNTRSWTRAEIDQEREDFFFTRVTGRQDVWQVLKTALEIVWAGGDDGEVDGGWATMQAILGAASITVPDGRMHRGVFDQQGAKYDIPKYVVCDPTNMAAEEPPVEDEIEDKSERASGEEEEDSEDEETKLQRREEKGKGVAVEQIQLRARRSDGGSRDLVITAGKEDTVKQVIRKFTQSCGLTPPKQIMLYYLGHKLDPDQTLTDQGWKDGHILQAFVSESQGQQSQSSSPRPM